MTTTTLIPVMLPSTGPSPSRNPFARPKLPSAGSFTRTSLLPTHASPRKPDQLATPNEKQLADASTSTSVTRDRTKSWRLLWRGGLEIGADGWRLDGIMFYAMLAFPSTPSGSTVNPFDFMSPPTQGTSTKSPFSLPPVDTDLCLSLESMRGRKYLQVRGVTELPEDEVLDGDNEEGGVQISISPQAPLLAGYLTGLLCRDSKLSSHGRTHTAVILGLGDEGVDPTHSSTLLVYGQRQPSDGDAPASLKLCVGRRKPPPPPPPNVRKVKPGDPLPRALVFSSKLNSKKLAHRPLSRSNSSASIYAPPVKQASRPDLPAASRSQSHSHLAPSKQLPPAPVSGRTPGRRGEKRRRTQSDEDDERKRRSGKIVMDKDKEKDKSDVKTEVLPEDEDIFGKRPVAVKNISFGTAVVQDDSTCRPGVGADAEPSSAGKKRQRVPQQILDNKATIRKQAMLLLEDRGCPRDHEQFKDVFSMATKGAYFAFRDRMEDGALCKLEVQRIIGVHLDMYLPSPAPGPSEDTKTEVIIETKIEYEEVETLRSIKEEDEDEETLVEIETLKTEAKSF